MDERSFQSSEDVRNAAQMKHSYRVPVINSMERLDYLISDNQMKNLNIAQTCVEMTVLLRRCLWIDNDRTKCCYKILKLCNSFLKIHSLTLRSSSTNNNSSTHETAVVIYSPSCHYKTFFHSFTHTHSGFQYFLPIFDK